MNRLSKDAKLILLIHSMFILSTSLSATFVNVYIWKLTSDFKVIGTYNIITFVFIMVTFILSGIISRKKNLPFCSILGIVSFMLFYTIVLWLKEDMITYLYPAAILLGCGNGFYYVSYNSYIYHYTDKENRINYFGKATGITTIMMTIAPVIAGYIISKMNGNQGYYAIFTISFILFLLAATATLFLKPVAITGSYNLSKAYKTSNKALHKVVIGFFFTGFREGGINYITLILVYMILQDELKVGQFTTLTSVLGVFCAFIIGRIVNKRNRLQFILIGSAMSFFATIILITFDNFWGILINGIILSLFTNVWTIPHNVITYEVFGNNINKGNDLSDFVIIKEIFINFGRVFGILLYIFVSYNMNSMSSIKIILPILSGALLLNYVMIKGVHKMK